MTPTTQTMEEAIRDEVAAEVKTPTSLPPNIFETPGPVKLQRRLTLVITLTPFVGFLVGMRLLWGGISGLGSRGSLWKEAAELGNSGLGHGQAQPSGNLRQQVG